MDVHIDPLLPAPRLYIIGAGHVGWHLARVAADAGFRVHVVDDREKFANAERFPGAGRRRRADPRVAAPRRAARHRPTSSSSRAATSTTSTRCARWRRATCATSA